MRKKALALIVLFLLLVIFTSCSPHPVQEPATGGVKREAPLAIEIEKATPLERSFQFVVLGDSKILAEQPQWRGNVILSELIQRINKDKPAFVVYLGDGPDQGGPVLEMRAFRNALSLLNCAWYPVIGNHELSRGAGPDGKKGDGEANFLEVFGDKLPVQDARGNKVSYYSFNYQDAHFIVLDTAWQDRSGRSEQGLTTGSAQWKWLERDLQSARSGNRHIFIFGHEPPLVQIAADKKPNQKLSDRYITTWNDIKVVESFIELCRQYHVEAVISGHFHAYRLFEENDTTHLISGGAGADLHVPPEFGGYYHYVRCTVAGDNVSYEVVRLN
jgi:hypothetical protein